MIGRQRNKVTPHTPAMSHGRPPGPARAGGCRSPRRAGHGGSPRRPSLSEQGFGEAHKVGSDQLLPAHLFGQKQSLAGKNLASQPVLLFQGESGQVASAVGYPFGVIDHASYLNCRAKMLFRFGKFLGVELSGGQGSKADRNLATFSRITSPHFNGLSMFRDRTQVIFGEFMTKGSQLRDEAALADGGR